MGITRWHTSANSECTKSVVMHQVSSAVAVVNCDAGSWMDWDPCVSWSEDSFRITPGTNLSDFPLQPRKQFRSCGVSVSWTHSTAVPQRHCYGGAEGLWHSVKKVRFLTVSQRSCSGLAAQKHNSWARKIEKKWRAWYESDWRWTATPQETLLIRCGAQLTQLSCQFQWRCASSYAVQFYHC